MTKPAQQDKLRPMDCKSLADVLGLKCSHSISGTFSMLIQHDGAVILCEQSPGEPATAEITIPRRNFLRLIEFYERFQ